MLNSTCVACGFPLSDPTRITGLPPACRQCGKMVVEPLRNVSSKNKRLALIYMPMGLIGAIVSYYIVQSIRGVEKPKAGPVVTQSQPAK